MDALLGWFTGLPLGALYALALTASLAEGLLPILPGDFAAAFLAFLIARVGGSLGATVGLITVGSIAGAIVMWWIGRRFGAAWLTARLGRMGFARTERKVEEAEQRVELAYRQYGWVALFVSRFIPGVRAAVPAVAGAIGLPLWEVTAIFSLASLLWYGGIAWVAFHVGRDWASVRAALERLALEVGVGAIAAAAVLVFIGWRLWKRRRARRDAAARASGSVPAQGTPPTPGAE